MKDSQKYREDEGRPTDQYSNGQVKQPSSDMSPAEGGDGYVGSNTGPDLGLNMVTGKKGYSQNMPIWEQKSSFTDYQDNTGSTGNAFDFPGQDPTDEKASYKKIQTDEGLPQTFRDSAGSGDASPAGADEPDARGVKPSTVYEHTQSVPSADAGDHQLSDFPQTEYTNIGNGGAPAFKFSGQTAPESLYKPKPRD